MDIVYFNYHLPCFVYKASLNACVVAYILSATSAFQAVKIIMSCKTVAAITEVYILLFRYNCWLRQALVGDIVHLQTLRG